MYVCGKIFNKWSCCVLASLLSPHQQTYTHARAHTHTSTHACTHTHTHTQARTHVHTHTQARTRVHTHTHTPLAWSCRTAWRCENVPRSTSWPLRRTCIPSLRREPKAIASAVPQSNPLPDEGGGGGVSTQRCHLRNPCPSPLSHSLFVSKIKDFKHTASPHPHPHFPPSSLT